MSNRLKIPLTLLCLLCCTGWFLCSRSASAEVKPTLTLNRGQGPLGVRLILQGKHFHPGRANLLYVDARNVPGVFTPPSDTSVQVQSDGSFVATQLILPDSGPVGNWKIVVNDSFTPPTTVTYRVMGAAGVQIARAPDLVINTTNGQAGDLFAFTGENWFPEGTSVTISLVQGDTHVALLGRAVRSDKNGAITGTFRLPEQTDAVQSPLTIEATDQTGALSSQTLLSIQIPVASPVPTQEPPAQPTVSVASSDPVSQAAGTTETFFLSDGVKITLLLAGGSLAGLALFLMFLAVRAIRGEQSHSRQW